MQTLCRMQRLHVWRVAFPSQTRNISFMSLHNIETNTNVTAAPVKHTQTWECRGLVSVQIRREKQVP